MKGLKLMKKLVKNNKAYCVLAELFKEAQLEEFKKQPDSFQLLIRMNLVDTRKM